jgi:hypothetical protein
LRRTQRGVQHRALLRDVDLLAIEHRVAALLDIRSHRQTVQQPHRLCRDRAFGPIEQQVINGQREVGEAACIVGKGLTQVDRRAFAMSNERRQGRGECAARHG